jgi:hypothetical protein
MSWYKGTIEWIVDGDRENEMIVIGAIDDPHLMEKLGAFTKGVVLIVASSVACLSCYLVDRSVLPQTKNFSRKSP